LARQEKKASETHKQLMHFSRSHTCPAYVDDTVLEPFPYRTNTTLFLQSGGW